jgi:hypothetical protein
VPVYLWCLASSRGCILTVPFSSVVQNRLATTCTRSQDCCNSSEANFRPLIVAQPVLPSAALACQL